MSYLPVRDGLLQVFNVEHGACALLTTPVAGAWQRILIDCGHNATTGFTPGQHLSKLGVREIDLLVVTNYDEDHVSGYRSLRDHGVGYRWILRNPSVPPAAIRQLKSETGIGPGMEAFLHDLQQVRPATRIDPQPTFGDVEIEWFYNVFPGFQDENNLSLVAHVRIRGLSFLFPGDMECSGFQNLLRCLPRFREVVASTDVLIASHHGRENGICPEMFADHNCRPQLVVISDDYKQYDTQETVQFFRRQCRGIAGYRGSATPRRVLTTRRDGEIRFEFDGPNCRAA